MHLLATALPAYVIFLFSICFHEFSHSLVATLRGDSTSQLMGRLTLNPMAHADPLGTVLLPILGLMSPFPMLGWAKPVPVNESNLKQPRVDMFWIAFAGPLSNILLATIGVFAFEFYQARIGQVPDDYNRLVGMLIGTNLGLAIFNMLPVYPLDGSKVVARFFPESWNRVLEENQQMISTALLFLLFFGGLRVLQYPIVWTLNGLTLVARSVVG
ncbi:MAG: site-2 protease family protein [Bdellovibrionia bacterium]